VSDTTVINHRLLREIVAAARDGDAAWVEVWCGDVAAELAALTARLAAAERVVAAARDALLHATKPDRYVGSWHRGQITGGDIAALTETIAALDAATPDPAGTAGETGP
jgi:hypothetical protein